MTAPGFVHRDAERFAHAKGIADVQDGRGLGTNRQRARETLRGKRAIADVEGQMKVPKNLQRIDPGFESSRLRRRTIPREFQRREETPRCESFATTPASPLGPDAGCWASEKTAYARQIPKRQMLRQARDAEPMPNTNQVRIHCRLLLERGFGRLELAKSRYPEYKK